MIFNIYKKIAEDVETRFDTSNYELECNSINGPLPKGKNKKRNWIKERWIRRKNHGKIGERKNEETYSYLIDYSSEDKKAKGTTKVFRKKKI